MNTQSNTEAEETVQTTNVPAVDQPRLVRLSDVTDDILDNVENELGMGCGAWDMVPPKDIIAAAWKFLPSVNVEHVKLNKTMKTIILMTYYAKDIQDSLEAALYAMRKHADKDCEREISIVSKILNKIK